ncbi:hypothetical protein GPU89_23345 [Burkholderia cepacia]|nr:hypothetical protein [Burkholderia cepacia]
MDVIAGDFRELGYAIVANDALQSLIKDVRAKFERHFIPASETTRRATATSSSCSPKTST